LKPSQKMMRVLSMIYLDGILLTKTPAARPSCCSLRFCAMMHAIRPTDKLTNA